MPSDKDLAVCVCVHGWVGLPHQERRDGAVPKKHRKLQRGVFGGVCFATNGKKDRENKCLQVCLCLCFADTHVLLHQTVCVHVNTRYKSLSTVLYMFMHWK